jgi:hypothetical protein
MVLNPKKVELRKKAQVKGEGAVKAEAKPAQHKGAEKK